MQKSSLIRNILYLILNLYERNKATVLN